MRSKEERGRGGESKWLKEAVIYVFVYVNGGNGRRGWGWDRGREGKWPEGLELVDDFLLEFEKRDKSFRFFCEGSMSISEVASLVVFDARRGRSREDMREMSQLR